MPINLNKDYEVLEVLGQGSFGMVRKVRVRGNGAHTPLSVVCEYAVVDGCVRGPPCL